MRISKFTCLHPLFPYVYCLHRWDYFTINMPNRIVNGDKKWMIYTKKENQMNVEWRYLGGKIEKQKTKPWLDSGWVKANKILTPQHYGTNLGQRSGALYTAQIHYLEKRRFLLCSPFTLLQLPSISFVFL